ncbi:MAG: phage major capsid protein [Thermodesulfobacteriota bacterium]
MSAKLMARPYQEAKQRRSHLELARGMDKYEIPQWPELDTLGERGCDISRVCFDGLRALGTVDDTGGGYLVDSKPMTAIEYLGHLLAARKAGAVVVNATAADFSPTPVEKTPPVPYWVDELNIPGDQTPSTWGIINPRMRSMICWADLTLQLRVATGGAAEGIATRSFLKALARGADQATFHGSGVDGQPTGIVNTPGVTVTDGGTFSLAKAAAMLKTVEAGNGTAISWVMDPATAELLRQRPKAANGERMIFEGGKILDCPALVSTGVAAGTLFCGDFSNVVLLLRSIDLNVDRSAKSMSGGVRLVYYLNGDVLVTQPQAFSVAQGVN